MGIPLHKPLLSFKFVSISALSFLIFGLGSCSKSSAVVPAQITNTSVTPVAPIVTTTSVNYANVDTAIFQKGKEGYAYYRIPALVTTLNGTILAFAEGRKNSQNDYGDIDVVMKRSTDGGLTWSPLTVVWNDGTNTCDNPTVIVDQLTGDVHVIMGWSAGTDTENAMAKGQGSGRRLYYTKSADNGLTWSGVQNITGSAIQANWFATGPGHSIQLSAGANAGRIVVPVYLQNTKSNITTWGVYMLYSDDHGLTWKSGNMAGQTMVAGGETSVAQLSDGSLLLNSRAVSGNNRLSARSTDGGVSWSNLQVEKSLLDALCEGSLLAVNFNNSKMLFLSSVEATTRTNLTIKVSKDDGSSWNSKLVVDKVNPFTAYSDLSIINSQQAGVLYEAGKSSLYESIRFKTFMLSDLSD